MLSTRNYMDAVTVLFGAVYVLSGCTELQCPAGRLKVGTACLRTTTEDAGDVSAGDAGAAPRNAYDAAPPVDSSFSVPTEEDDEAAQLKPDGSTRPLAPEFDADLASDELDADLSATSLADAGRPSEPATCVPKVESCNLLDDDCDGTIDDGCMPPTRVASLGVGFASTCVALSNGEVWCWGWNAFGQVGDGTTMNRFHPTKVVGVSDAIEVTVGLQHACALVRDGSLTCWGDNSFGALGNNSTISVPTPVKVIDLQKVKDVSAGFGVTCAIVEDGGVYCWGALKGNTVELALAPTRMQDLQGASEISLGMGYGGCTRMGTSVSCWDREGVASAVPGVNDAVEVKSGNLHSCAITSAGTTSCWTRTTSSPTVQGPDVAPGAQQQLIDGAALATSATALGCGYTSSCILRKDQTVWCWGDGRSGQLGTGGNGASGPIPGLSATSIALGFTHACAQTTSGAVACWGSNGQGQLGTDGVSTRFFPVSVVGLP
jgi:Regulator of chromosome condensation (RCC1) repeat